MLGCDDVTKVIGGAWLNYDSRVWVCPNLNKAKQVLAESQKSLNVEPNPIWTIVYQVSGRDLVFEQAHNGLLYTNTPTKLFVERVVLRKPQKQICEEYLLNNANQIKNNLAKFWENVK